MTNIQPQLPLAQSAPKKRLRRVASMADLVEGQGARGPKPRGFVIRFWEMVKKAAPDECWEWIGQRDKTTGYGLISICNGPYLAHRISFLIEHGKIDPDLVIMHSCDNHGCVNPSHLSQGTPSENTQDALRKNRMLKGELNGMSKLLPDQVLEIRRRHSAGDSLGTLAVHYGVQVPAIHRIVTGKRWKHLG